MNISDIRPLSTYIGNGGVSKMVKNISMKTDGSLKVEWRRVAGNRNNRNTPLRGTETIEQFALWAKILIDTWSTDLKHHLDDVSNTPSGVISESTSSSQIPSIPLEINEQCP